MSNVSYVHVRAAFLVAETSCVNQSCLFFSLDTFDFSRFIANIGFHYLVFSGLNKVLVPIRPSLNLAISSGNPSRVRPPPPCAGRAAAGHPSAAFWVAATADLKRASRLDVCVAMMSWHNDMAASAVDGPSRQRGWIRAVVATHLLWPSMSSSRRRFRHAVGHDGPRRGGARVQQLVTTARMRPLPKPSMVGGRGHGLPRWRHCGAILLCSGETLDSGVPDWMITTFLRCSPLGASSL